MGLRINQNIAAMNAYRNLSVTDSQMAKSLEKLSSGFRINRAADDAAGLSVSEGLRAQIGGLKVAVRNAQDGISVVQTAEGALTEVHSILQRMRDLAVQAANGGASDTNAQAAAQTEFGNLQKELDRIARTTGFGNQKLLNTSYNGTFQVGANNTANDRIQVDLSANIFGTPQAAAPAGVTYVSGAIASFNFGTATTPAGPSTFTVADAGSGLTRTGATQTFSAAALGITATAGTQTFASTDFATASIGTNLNGKVFEFTDGTHTSAQVTLAGLVDNTSTVDDVVSQLNHATTGLGSNFTASKDGSGNLVITSTATGTGVTVSQGSNDTSALTASASTTGVNGVDTALNGKVFEYTDGTNTSAQVTIAGLTSSSTLADVVTQLNDATNGLGSHFTASTASGSLVVTSAATGTAVSVAQGSHDTSGLTASGAVVGQAGQHGTQIFAGSDFASAGIGTALNGKVFEFSDGTNTSAQVTLAGLVDGTSTIDDVVTQLNHATTGLGSNFTASKDGSGNLVITSTATGTAVNVTQGTHDTTAATATSSAASGAGWNAQYNGKVFKYTDGTNTSAAVTISGLTSTSNLDDIVTQLNNASTGLGANFTAANVGNKLVITSTATGTGASVATATGDTSTLTGTTAAGTAVVPGTNKTFTVDGHTVNLTTDTTDAAGLAAAIQTQLDAAAPSTYLVSGDATSGKVTISKGGSTNVAIAGTDAALFTTGGVTGTRAATYATADAFDAAGLGVGTAVTVDNTAHAQAAISLVDNAIKSVSTARATMGAYQNRFEHTINNLNVAVENLSASESRIRDVDMAQEMVAFTRSQILSQAGTAMLAQANQAPQSVLKLLQ